MRNPSAIDHIKPVVTHFGLTHSDPEFSNLVVLSPKISVGNAGELNAPPTSALYPHIYDLQSEGETAIALRQVEAAGKDIENAIQCFTEGDLVGCSSSLMLVAGLMASAHKNTSFNQAFGAVVSHVRRSTVLLGADVELNQLMVLQRTIKALHDEPHMNLMRSGALILDLESAGFMWEMPDVDRLLAELLREESLDAEIRGVAEIEEERVAGHFR